MGILRDRGAKKTKPIAGFWAEARSAKLGILNMEALWQSMILRNKPNLRKPALAQGLLLQ